MKSYLVVTGVLFALMFLVHLWRIVAERPTLLSGGGATLEAVSGCVAAALSVWAWRLLRRRDRA